MPHAPDEGADDRMCPRVAAIIKAKAARLAARAGLRPQDREDLEQELALHVLERRDRFDPARGTWPAFAHRLAERFASNFLRARRAAKRDGGPLAPLTADVPGPEPGDPELPAEVARALAGLPDDLRAAAELVMAATVAEAARKLGVARSTVYARLAELTGRAEVAALADFL
ncbi:sigma-70 family RNA polymerase sigma factor [Gemmata sp.]|uniref:sigma-70 family RNA polymerase sigma factor n=1 Tax=Gemmata sp. TaxID=1914242 RepID=UPI003F711366